MVSVPIVKLKFIVVKSKYFLLSILTLAFLSSSMPSGNSFLETGKEVPSLNIKDTSGQLIEKRISGKNLIVNLWSSDDAKSRVRNIKLSKLMKTEAGKNVIFLSVCTDNDQLLGNELKKLDGIDSHNILNLNRSDLSVNFLKLFQVESGNRLFLIDKKGILKNIMPTEEEILYFSHS